jgi:serine protease Do
VFQACKDAVVNISTTQFIEVRPRFGFGSGSIFDEFFDEFFELPTRPPTARRFKTTAVGSGFVIHPSGYVLTNAHVVARTASQTVIFANGERAEAEIVAVGAEQDIAILKIPTEQPLASLTIGTSEDLMVGETVIAIGNPLGLENTVTAGVISALDRRLEMGTRIVYKGLIQTDASINPGNSGGPLLNVLGELIGVNTAIRGDAQNIGFAIPVDQLTEALPRLLDVQRRYRIETGIEVSNTGHPTITAVQDGKPGARAGLRVGDELLSVDHQPVTKGIDYHIGLIGKQAEDRAEMTLLRDGRRLRTVLVLAGKPKPDGVKLALEKFGLELEDLSPAVSRRLGLEQINGLVVVRVQPASPAAEIGIEPADIAIEVDGQSTTQIADLGLMLENIRSGQSVRIAILRIANRTIYRLTAPLRAR